MSPDAEDASPSPEPGAEQDPSGTMAEETKQERASTEEKSPNAQASNGNANSSSTAKSNAKDPSRPRRKKARRACFACQRAHLTCGDERPCLRCIKRGLQDQCHDGVRKKAKYLHDAPPEALVPGYAANNYAMNGSQSLTAVPGVANVSPHGLPASQSGAYFPQTAAGGFPQYTHAQQQGSMGPPMMDSASMVADFSSAQTVETPIQYQSTPSQQVSPNQEINSNLDQTPSIGTAGQSFDTTYFDANDPSLFNFNISDLNFGNHYGALEFGMLGHISSGAVGTPDMDSMNQMGGHSNQGSVSYDGSHYPGFGGGYSQGFPPWQNAPNAGSRQSSTTNIWGNQNNGLEAYAIGEQASSITGASPHSQSQDFTGYQSATQSPETQFAQPDQNNQSDQLLRQSLSQAQFSRKQPPFPGDPHIEMDRKRRRNTSEVYTSVTEPYSYTQGFHALTALLQKRFPQKKVLRIAKALGMIRPSFISCNQHLNHDDLIFMEKCFQRTLCEYETFVNHYGTPTVICRRTGEIAAVSKEFCLVTGWRRDVLLGKEPNLNVNTGGSSSGTQTGTSSRGAVTPRIPNIEADPGRPQPVFLAELMDEDSVVQFYEDFSELAFGASRTSIMEAPCSLLKYRTKEDPGWGPSDHVTDDGKRVKKHGDHKSEPLIRGEAGMHALGERDGRVECQMCWTVKRDVFDIPMLIVMNFLPVI
ncbi:Transcription activator of gluconeogenesis [Pseudocercospora fuligena]|uniref:Transcription activator of gluconeogenesis n=1 Tax=Pseudocercospora fuligena TaxID=685502 RepID=A0A8H6R4Q1_9PEZI|nr:Transcription activator of gluconeogenesis [Pseudocercospora fuligena]